jgi:hypothetical protein
VIISSGRVHLASVWLAGGLRLRFSPGALVRSATISAGGQLDAVTGVRSRLRLHTVRVVGGLNSALFVDASTVAVERARVDATASRRGVLASSSSVALTAVTVLGGRSEQILSRTGSLRADRLWLQDGPNTGVSAVRGGRVDLRRASIEAGRFGVVLGGVEARVVDSRIVGRHAFALGVTNATVALSRVDLVGERGGALSVSGSRRRSRLDWRQGSVGVGRGSGLEATQATLHLHGVRFAPTSTRTPSGEGIVLSGPGTRAELSGVELRSLTGMAVTFANRASGAIRSSTIADCGGGIAIHRTWDAPLDLDDVAIEACRGSPGVSVVDAEVRASRVRLDDCAWVAADGAAVDLDHVRVRADSGLQAFGGAQIRTRSSTVAGDTWATFCDPFSRILVDASRLDGPQADACGEE